MNVAYNAQNTTIVTLFYYTCTEK